MEAVPPGSCISCTRLAEATTAGWESEDGVEIAEAVIALERLRVAEKAPAAIFAVRLPILTITGGVIRGRVLTLEYLTQSRPLELAMSFLICFRVIVEKS